MAGRIFVAKTTWRSKVNGRIIRRDLTTVREGHPVYEREPSYFKPFVVTYDLEPAPPVPVAPEAPRARQGGRFVKATPEQGSETVSTADDTPEE